MRGTETARDATFQSREWRHYDGDDIDDDDDDIVDIDIDVGYNEGRDDGDADDDGAEEILSRSLSSVRLLRQRQHAHIRPGGQKPAAR